MRKQKKEKDLCIVNRTLSIIAKNERLEQDTFLFLLSSKSCFNSELFGELMHSISYISRNVDLLNMELLCQLYSIQRIVLVLLSSHLDVEDLYNIVSDDESWRDNLSELDTIIYSYITEVLQRGRI